MLYRFVSFVFLVSVTKSQVGDGPASVNSSAESAESAEDPDNIVIFEDFEGPVKALPIMVLIMEISNEIRDLFEEKTAFDSIEKELLKNEVDYIFPNESMIIERIGV